MRSCLCQVVRNVQVICDNVDVKEKSIWVFKLICLSLCVLIKKISTCILGELKIECAATSERNLVCTFPDNVNSTQKDFGVYFYPHDGGEGNYLKYVLSNYFFSVLSYIYTKNQNILDCLNEDNRKIATIYVKRIIYMWSFANLYLCPFLSFLICSFLPFFL